MGSIICTAGECRWNDTESDTCTRGSVIICPSIDSAEPAYCDSYEDIWSWEEGVNHE